MAKSVAPQDDTLSQTTVTQTGMRYTRKAFEQVGKAAVRMSPTKGSFFDRLFDRLLPSMPTNQELDWSGEADWARMQQEPLRARGLLWIVSLAVVLLLVWSGFAELDEVARGEGEVIPTSQLQVVQASDPGSVKSIEVREGQSVEKGQLLLRVDPTRFNAELGANRVETLNLMAKKARLEALIEGRELAIPEEVLKDVPETAAHEHNLYISSRSEIDAQLGVARQQLAQREEEHREATAGHVQAVEGLALAAQELEKTVPLVQSGAVSEVEIIRLRSSVSKFKGDRDQYQAKISRMKAAIAEWTEKIQQIELAMRNQWSKELSETKNRLDPLLATAAKGVDMVEKAQVRSPVRGTVNRLLVNTVGAVVLPGKELIEIMPVDEELVVEARVKPKDIGFLRPGLPAVVKITAFDFSIYGGLDATVKEIMPGTVKDDKGNAFYHIKVQTFKSTLGNNSISPGMVAEVDVLTGKKTVLSYLLKPLVKGLKRSMTEK